MTESAAVPPPEASDAMLLTAIAAGDRDAFQHFYLRWSPNLLSVLRHLARADAVAEDVLQDVFLTVWRRAAGYDPSRGDVGGWLYVICRSRWIDFLRRSRPGDASDHDLYETAASVPVGRRELSLDLRKALAMLKDDERRALELAYFGGLTHEEAAERLELPLGTLKSRIRLALRKLAKKMKSYDRDDC